jgi:tetratricopeptide (TPR) repeat protein
MNLGYLAKLLAYCRGEYDAARAAAEEGVAFHEVAGFDFHLALTLLTLGDVHLALGDFAAAERAGERALEMCTVFQGDAEVMVRGGAYTLLGHVGRLRDESDRATARYRQALLLLRHESRTETTVWAAGMSMDGLARIALAEGRTKEARAHAEEALALLRQYAVHGMLFLPAAIDLACPVRVGEALTLEDELDRAETHLLDALSRARARKRIPAALEALVALAELRKRQGDAGEAAELFTVVAAHAASPSWLAGHAKRVLDVLARPGGRSGRKGGSLADALSFVLDGDRSP